MTKVLQGKTALVTGASRGLGRGTAERLAASGAIVAVNYAGNEKAADEVVSTITRAGGEAFKIQAKLGEPGAKEALIAGLDREFQARAGRNTLDILVNNIGGDGYGRFADVTEETYDYIFALNLRSPFFLTQALLSRLADGGRVINIGSAASRLNGQDFIVYSMAKAGLDSFTKVLAKELGPRRINVNSVLPGFNATEANQGVMDDAAIRKMIEADTLLGRFGEPEDIAAAVHFLATPDAAWLTGQLIEASGGFKF